MAVLFETSIGELVFDLFYEKCPLACENFIKLCKLKFYHNSLFIEVQKDYLVEIKHKSKHSTSLNEILYGEQAKYFEDQIYADLKHNKIGLLSTSNKGPNLNNSNFFITLTDENLLHLNGKHTVFGVVSEGIDILNKINECITDDNNRPYVNIRIIHTYILDDPFKDNPQLKFPINSPEITEDERLEEKENQELMKKNSRSEKEIIEKTKSHEAKTKAIILEMLDDLPDADVKPPDNILFVCKLNPVTTERDLEVVFSRFGSIRSCEIIRDWKTGASLQYAFIEFETTQACEQAFFKMENVLLDERRIHVDFSQSVSKIWHKSKKFNSSIYKKEQEIKLKSSVVPNKGNYKMIFEEKKDRKNREIGKSREKKSSRHHNYKKKRNHHDNTKNKKNKVEERKKKRRYSSESGSLSSSD